MYQLEDFSNSRSLLMEDLLDLEKKKIEAERILTVANADYVSKRKLYRDA